MKKLLSFIFFITIIIGFSACSQNDPFSSNTNNSNKPKTYNENIDMLVDKLTNNAIITKNDKIAVTSALNLNNKGKTTDFGRKLDQSIYNTLRSRGYSLVDVRGTKTMNIDANGEIFITKQDSFINKKQIENSYILVITYSNYGDGILVNSRIVDYMNGRVIARARSVITINTDPCYQNENCDKTVVMKQVIKELMEENKKLANRKTTMQAAPKRKISLQDANCTQDCTSDKTSMLGNKVKSDTKSDKIPEKEEKVYDYR